MLSRREFFLILLSTLSYNDALDSTTKPLARSPIAYNNHYGAHLPASPAHDILTKTSLFPHLHPQPAMIKVPAPPANARLTHIKKPSHVIDILGHVRIRRLRTGILGFQIRRRLGILMRGLRQCIGRRGRRWRGRLGVGSIGGGEVLEGHVAEENGLCAVRMFCCVTCLDLLIFVTFFQVVDPPLPSKTRIPEPFSLRICSPFLKPVLGFT